MLSSPVYIEAHPPRSAVFASRTNLRDAAFASRMNLRDAVPATPLFPLLHLTPLLAIASALFRHSLHQECSRTLSKSRRSALFCKIPGIGYTHRISSFVFCALRTLCFHIVGVGRSRSTVHPACPPWRACPEPRREPRRRAANSFRIRSCAKGVGNPFRIRSYENTRGEGGIPIVEAARHILPLRRLATSRSVGDTVFALPYAPARLPDRGLFGQSKHVGGLR
jgi:hypothetical protein